MSWGNNGYGQEDVYGRLNNTKPVESRDPFIGEGPHTLALISLEEFMHQTHGPSARATFEVLASRVHPVGSRVTKLWFLVKPSKFASQANDGDRFVDFCRKLKGAPDTYQMGNDIRVLMKERVNEQLARGKVIEAMGVNTSKKADKPYIDVRWTHVVQAPEQIAQMRAQLEAKLGPSTMQQPAQQTQVQQPMQNPQPQWQQGPAQPAQQPQWQPAQPQQAPQGGFLGQLPPQGNPQGNPQGGNQGGGSW